MGLAEPFPSKTMYLSQHNILNIMDAGFPPVCHLYHTVLFIIVGPLFRATSFCVGSGSHFDVHTVNPFLSNSLNWPAAALNS